MSSLPSHSQEPIPDRAPQQERGAWRGILIGLRPLALLLVVIILALTLNMLIRALDVSEGFFVQQEVAIITLLIGLVVAIVVYTIAIRRTLKRIERWQQAGAVRHARFALWSLGITALVVALPVVLAIVLPQNPAP
jgi:fumarate reductase subunit D